MALSPPSVLIVRDIKRFGRSNVADLDLDTDLVLPHPPLPFIVGFSFVRVLTLEANTFNAATLVLIKAKMDTANSGLGKAFLPFTLPPGSISLSFFYPLSLYLSILRRFVRLSLAYTHDGPGRRNS